MQLTIKLRLKDKHCGRVCSQIVMPNRGVAPDYKGFEMAKIRMPTDKVPARGGRSHGPSNVPAPTIPRPMLNQNPQRQVQQLHPEMYPKQLNPISNQTGQPQYNNEVPAQHLMALIAALRGS